MHKIPGFLLSAFITCVIVASHAKVSYADYGFMDDSFSDYSFSSSFMGRGRSQQIISLEVNPQRTLDTSFRIAAREGREKEVRLFLQKGAEINSRSSSGETALIYAVKNCSKNLVLLLLRGGADVNARDVEGRTPLIHAANGSCQPAAEALLKNAALDVTAKDKSHRTALDYAQDNSVFEVDGPSEEIIRLIEAAKKRKAQKVARPSIVAREHSSS
jgi:ankyrin repeat protein